MTPTPTTETSIDALTGIMLAVFRLNATLLDHGDRLVAPIGLTSARWQILGAIALAGEPQTAPQIAQTMGVTRQGAQKQLHLACQEGLVLAQPNPRHARSPQYELTPHGCAVYERAIRLQRAWCQDLLEHLDTTELPVALSTLAALQHALEHHSPTATPRSTP
jgi:DNA-binding MarR family transcriptional regulator